MASCSSPSRRPRALIVEDEVLIALGLEAHLDALGFDVLGLAANARKAISLAMEDTPDIAVIDIYLNGARDGIETARTLRELCGVPIVFVTAYGDEEGILERIQRQVPGAPVLSKPLYGHRLGDAIAEVTERASSLYAQAESLDGGRAIVSRSERPANLSSRLVRLVVS
jgi:DNA-binding NarL/FixJ family response regulator